MDDKLLNETLLSMIAEVQDYGIILLDTKGNIKHWDTGAERIKGYSEKEILGKNFRIFYTEEDQELDKPERLLRAAAEDGRAIDEGWRIRNGGERFWGSITITAIHSKQGAIVGFGKVTRDLTEFRQAEQVRALEIKNKELEQFNYLASHDLQEPLRTVSNYITVIKEDFENELDPEVIKYLNTIEKAASRMSVLIKCLLNYSRLGKTQTSTLTDINLLVWEVVADLESLISASNAVIQVGPLPELYAYPPELRQLFQNLVANSIKFKRAGVDPEISIFCKRQHGDWLFSVKDNGIGIEEMNYERIFGIFQRIEQSQKLEGYGIGLANCKKIIELHNGHIWVESVFGQDATFYFTIPNKVL